MKVHGRIIARITHNQLKRENCCAQKVNGLLYLQKYFKINTLQNVGDQVFVTCQLHFQSENVGIFGEKQSI